MGVPRFRTEGPAYFPRERRMEVWNWDWGQRIWFRVPASDSYYPNPPLINVLRNWVTCSDELHPGPPYRVGGPLFLRRIAIVITPSQYCDVLAGSTRYKGTFVCIPNQTLMTDTYNAYVPTAGSWGAAGWNKARPVKPIADAGQFLGELRDFPRMLKMRLRGLKDVGGEYLNHQFGWVPFINDIKKFIKLQDTIEDRLARIRKDNGKWRKRKCTIRNDSSTTSSSSTGRVSPVVSTNAYTPHLTPDPAQITVTTVDKIWFEGCMRFWIDDLDVDSSKSIWTSRIRQKLWGAELTPSLLWELTPWSWLNDWCVNLGDIYSNLSNSAYDSLVAKYAFVMRYRQTREEVSWVDALNAFPSGKVYPKCITVSSAECKERQTASQWGFGQLDEGDLTPRQLAILAALGISRI